MKFKHIILPVLGIFLCSTSCSSDDDVAVAPSNTVFMNTNAPEQASLSNFDTTIDENPTAGLVLGTMSTTGSGSMSFSMTSESPAGAMSIDANSGELTVLDRNLFDFETNPTITANVQVDISGEMYTATVTISLNDVDRIGSFLSTSQSNYTAANNGDWIEITEAEYNMLASNMNEITRAGTSASEYDAAVLASHMSSGQLVLSNTTTTDIIPNNGYVIAFKYRLGIQSTVTGFKVKQSSTANNSGFSDVGNVFPSHSGANQTDVFFVLKGNTSPVTANGYLGLFKSSSSSLTLFDNGTSHWDSPNATTLNGQLSRKALYQGLSTTEMQW